jgi:thiol-disulfide isomerase/thioredoxin
LVLAVSMVATTSASISAPETRASITKVAQGNPCASKSPCAGKKNPCAGKKNPCAGKKNPCAGKKNPCAGKNSAQASVGGPLAKSLQGKPVIVDVYASWCPGCKNIAPTLSQLKQEYAGKANFVVLDVSDRAKLKQTEAMAKKLGLGKFLAANKSSTSTVAIVDPATGNILTMFKNNANKSDYSSVIDTALAQK